MRYKYHVRQLVIKAVDRSSNRQPQSNHRLLLAQIAHQIYSTDVFHHRNFIGPKINDRIVMKNRIRKTNRLRRGKSTNDVPYFV